MNNDKPQQPFFSAPSEHISSDDQPEICAGIQIAQYVVERELGRGAMGVVYLAKDSRLNRFVAIKSLPAHMKDDKEAIFNMQHEAKLLAKLNHSNIGLIHDILKQDDNCYLVLEYIPGQTLAELMTNGKLKVSEIIPLSIQIVEAMSEAHRVDIVHRDIKPSNIKITGNGKVKVLDFGIGITCGQSSLQNVSIPVSSRSAGTPAYMSPEQVRAESIDQRSDIWAFGCMLYEMLSGNHPFAEETTSGTFSSVLTKQPDWSALPEKTDSELKEIIECCLQKDLEKRYASSDILLKKLQTYQLLKTGSTLNLKILWRHIKKPRFAIALVMILTVVSWIVFHTAHRRNKIKWARTEAVPSIVEYIQDEKYCKAYNLAAECSKWIPDDKVLNGLWQQMSTSDFSLDTVPSDAKLFYRGYSDIGGTWQFLGKSPISNSRFPYGCFRLRVKKEGYNVTERYLLNTFTPMFNGPLPKIIDLFEIGEIPTEMVYVPSLYIGGATLWMMGGGEIQMGHYFIDKNEVTNKEYYEFIKAGGYQKDKFWKHRFIKDGKELLWEQAIALMHDLTYQPGPKHWKNGKYPDGKEDFPVTGISWYEADAYACYRGKSLPTVYHWIIASMPLFTSSYTIPLSNYSKDGPMPVGTTQGMNLFGSYDMAGNVKEWCYNAKDETEAEKYTLGGAWNEPDFSFYVPSSENSFHRTEQTGFRCIKQLPVVGEAKKWGFLGRTLDLRQRNLHEAKPVTDHDFNLLVRGHFSYDHNMPLDAEEIDISDSSKFYRKKMITINAAYGGERMDLLLLLPQVEDYSPPYQPVIIFPSVGGLSKRPIGEISEETFRLFLIKSGRAVVLPIYKGMYNRAPLPYKWTLSLSSLPVFEWGKDWMRTVDYLKTRNDIDVDKLSFFGYSLGGVIGTFISGPEEQPFKACVLRVGGIPIYETPPPERDPVNYLPRIKIPILMLNGQNDSVLPLDASQKPMYKLLGTPIKDKHFVVIPEGTHKVPIERLEEEMNQFLDRYLGKPYTPKSDHSKSNTATLSN